MQKHHLRWLVLLALIIFWMGVLLAFKVHDEPLGHYSLIVTDAHGLDWVVDYNLTITDCLNMKASPAAACSRQPGGILP